MLVKHTKSTRNAAVNGFLLLQELHRGPTRLEAAGMFAFSIIGWLLLALAALGCGYSVAAALAVRRFFAAAPVPPRSEAGVTILKPLHGAEPRLVDNLATFLAQDHAGPVQLLCGVADPRDPAVLAIEVLRMRYPTARIDLVVDARRRGRNGKVSNLVNMEPYIAHPLVVLSDSDMAAPRDYLSGLVEAAARPGVGVVTCLYRGRGDAGWASRLAAAGLSYRFLLDATFASVSGQIGDACMGSTIALRRETLAAIGGFARFADVLADDHAIGQAVRATGRTIAIPPLLLTHACDEPTLAAVWSHELRWATTVRQVTPPLAYAGAVITHPLPLALVGALFHPVAGLTVALVAVAVRAFAAAGVDRTAGEETAPLWWLPARDLLSFAIYLASFGARRVEWRGERLRVAADGRIAAEPAE
jgi:ceramide glucosyltransferase